MVEQLADDLFLVAGWVREGNTMWQALLFLDVKARVSHEVPGGRTLNVTSSAFKKLSPFSHAPICRIGRYFAGMDISVSGEGGAYPKSSVLAVLAVPS